MFADDSTFLATSKSITELKETLGGVYTKISQWFRANELCLNLKKTRVMAFYSKTELNLRLDGVPIEEISTKSQQKSVKLLGIEVDPWLTWSEHVQSLVSKLRSYLYGLRRIRYEVDEFVRLSYVKSYLMSSIQYGIEIWGGSSHFHLLEKIQKQAVRLIKAKAFVIHTSALFREFKILPLSLILEQKERCMAFKYAEDGRFEETTSRRQQDKGLVRLPL